MLPDFLTLKNSQNTFKTHYKTGQMTIKIKILQNTIIIKYEPNFV